MFSKTNFNPEPLNCAYPVIKETIPSSSLGYTTNNKYPGFPPIMSDGRAVTASWQPEAVINESLIKDNHIESNWEYRQYLTKNANAIMESNFRESCNDVGYYKRANQLLMKDQAVNATAPYTYKSVMDNERPKGYTSSDLKELYLSREQLNARKIAPSLREPTTDFAVGKITPTPPPL